MPRRWNLYLALNLCRNELTDSLYMFPDAAEKSRRDISSDLVRT
jgi:hypothetical protein